MASKDEILTGIAEVEARLDRMLPGILENLNRPLLEGEWSVHDALCHMADDVPATPRWIRTVEAAINNTPRPAAPNLGDINQQGVDARKGKPIEEVVQEIRDGLHGDAAEIPGLDEALLAHEIPTRSGELQAASERLKFYAVGHNHMHLDEIEKAIAANAAT